MYWEIGAYVSNKVKRGGWGKAVDADFSKFIQAEFPDIKGFSASNIWRMHQFYEMYNGNDYHFDIIILIQCWDIEIDLYIPI